MQVEQCTLLRNSKGHTVDVAFGAAFALERVDDTVRVAFGAVFTLERKEDTPFVSRSEP